MAAMADGITSTVDLPLHVLDRLFDSFRDESLSDVDDRNNYDVGELSDRAAGETDTDSGSICDRCSDVSNEESDGVNPEPVVSCAMYYQCTINVLSMLDDASLSEFGFCKKEKVYVNPSTCKV